MMVNSSTTKHSGDDPATQIISVLLHRLGGEVTITDKELLEMEDILEIVYKLYEQKWYLKLRDKNK